jgi:hypothetical protein
MAAPCLADRTEAGAADRAGTADSVQRHNQLGTSAERTTNDGKSHPALTRLAAVLDAREAIRFVAVISEQSQ